MRSLLRRSGRAVLVTPTLGLLALAPSVLAASTSVRLAGPNENQLGSFFTYKLTGFASGRADYLVAWEQLYPRAGCAATYMAESARTFLPSTYGLMPAAQMALTRGRRFSTSLTFHAVNPGSHALCVFVISVKTGGHSRTRMPL